MEEEKLAVDSGYFPLFRREPNKEISIDSKADFDKYYEFIAGEDRYKTLKKINPDSYKELLEENMEHAKERLEYFENLKDEKEDK